jgi:ubiquinone/menaquinone biosynthesis C-methylase UbiE
VRKIPWIRTVVWYLFNRVIYQMGDVLYMNLNKPWKYKDNSVDIVYASHTFEHLSQKSAKLFLSEAYRCLKPGGSIRLVVPDLYKICKKYIDEYEHGDAEDPTTFIMWAINMNREGQYGNPGFFKRIIFEFQGYPHQHKFMYDEKSLGKRMKEVGFDELVSLQYGVSKHIEDIKDVEGIRESYLSIYIEGVKK